MTLFVYLFVSRIIKQYSNDFHKFVGKAALGPRKKPLDFGGNVDHVTLGLGLRFTVTVDVPRHNFHVTVRRGLIQTPPH